MCNELFLAFLYFVTIAIVNFFLLKLFKKYTQTIVLTFQLKSISNQFKIQKNSIFFLLFNIPSFSNFKFSNFSQLKFIETQDILILGNTYTYLEKNLPMNSNVKIYFQLLQLQYY